MAAPQLPPIQSLSSPIFGPAFFSPNGGRRGDDDADGDDLNGTMAADFDKQSYWHDRFASETSFEWLLPSADFMAMIEPHLARQFPDAASRADARVLQLGFGTSDVQNHFRARGFRHVLNVDYEPLAVDRGRDAEARAFGDVRMRYAVRDATQLDTAGERFDLVFDKSTIDAVSCAGEEAVRRMAAGVRACLAPGAVWVTLSFSASRFDLDGLPFDVEVLAKVPTPKLKPTDPDIYYWCYLLRPN